MTSLTTGPEDYTHTHTLMHTCAPMHMYTKHYSNILYMWMSV